jgi:hypothetical protein
MPHSPRWYQNKLWVLESGNGTLATVDVDSGQLETVAFLKFEDAVQEMFAVSLLQGIRFPDVLGAGDKAIGRGQLPDLNKPITGDGQPEPGGIPRPGS